MATFQLTTTLKCEQAGTFQAL